MDSSKWPRIMEDLVRSFSQLPGIGRKTAQRLVYEIIEKDEEYAEEFANALIRVKKEIHPCAICGNLTDQDICVICSDKNRDRSTITIVENSQSLLSIENTRAYHGLYHVLGGVLSPRDNITYEDLNIESLIERIEDSEVREIIIALSPTTDGELTANFISEILSDKKIKTSSIAKGIPIGASLDSFDETSLFMAIQERRTLHEE